MKNLQALLNCLTKRMKRVSRKSFRNGGTNSTLRNNQFPSIKDDNQISSYAFEDINISIKKKISNWQDLAIVLNRFFSFLYGFGSILIVIIYILPLTEEWSKRV